MAISSLMAVVSIAGTALGAYGQMQQAAQQQQSAATQAAIARRNAQMSEQSAQVAEEEGRAARRESHNDAQRARLQAAQMIGAERAMSAASGVQADAGSPLDLTLDIAERGEIDALRRIEQGDQADYKQRLKAGQYRAQAQNSLTQASLADDRADGADGAGNTLGQLQAGYSLLSGALRQGSAYNDFLKNNSARL